MHTPASEIQTNASLRTRICIIGAGAAGITLARHFAKEKIDAIVLESGAFDPMSEIQSLYSGESSGAPFTKDYLLTSRLRYFGGTTNHWGGYCRPLDEIDFRVRPWVPYSGWPITFQDLVPYYQSACTTCEVHDFLYESDFTLEKKHIGFQTLAPGALISQIIHESPPTRFGTKYRKELLDAPSVRLITLANVVTLTANASGRVTQAHVRTLSGASCTVEADIFILALGGIENARLLLLSNEQYSTGLGNEHDNVGRFFMDHLGFPNVGSIIFTKRFAAAQFHAKNESLDFLAPPIFPVFSLSNTVMEREKLQRVAFYLRIRNDNPLHTDAIIDDVRVFTSPTEFESDIDIRDDAPAEYRLQIWHSELRPNRESRITLDSQRDALGLFKSKLTWAYTPEDVDNVYRSIHVLAKELGQRGLGRVLCSYSPQDLWNGSEFGCHHIGTTRMSSDPKDGVVDMNLRLHSCPNVFVAGSSVFATMGCANPTLTIVALAHRLAEHVSKIVTT